MTIQTGKARNKAADTGWRGSQEAWLDAAYDMLKEAGVDGVRVMPLAKKIKLSRTSFYWFFTDREELLAGLIGRWREKNTGGLVKQCEGYAETIAEAILNVFECWLDPHLFDSQFEFAIRSWALQSADVASEVAAADQVRINALAGMFRKFGYEVGAADARARTIYLTQIGYITMKTDEGIIERFKRIPEYVCIFTGQVPEPRELDRFYARFGYALDADAQFVPMVTTYAEVAG